MQKTLEMSRRQDQDRLPKPHCSKNIKYTEQSKNNETYKRREKRQVKYKCKFMRIIVESSSETLQSL